MKTKFDIITKTLSSHTIWQKPEKNIWKLLAVIALLCSCCFQKKTTAFQRDSTGWRKRKKNVLVGLNQSIYKTSIKLLLSSLCLPLFISVFTEQYVQHDVVKKKPFPRLFSATFQFLISLFEFLRSNQFLPTLSVLITEKLSWNYKQPVS